jgi:ceramide glucosyltransferase
LLGVAAIPFIYYLLALYSSWKYFAQKDYSRATRREFTPPVTCFKAIRGLDEDAYENFASFCRQDYPEYEILFCVDENDPTIPVLQRLMRDYPQTKIRLIYGPDHQAINDKVARLDRLSKEARYDLWVLTDGDVRVEPSYLRTVVSPMQDSQIGGVTCFYYGTKETTFIEKLQELGMMCDFFPGILVAWLLDGVKFGFGQTIVTTRKHVQGFGGFATIESRPADDLLTCRLIAEQGYEIKLLPYVVRTTPDFRSMKDLLYKRTRWMTVMRHMRPWGHLGLVFTLGLPWALLAVAVHPTPGIAAGYIGGYVVFRAALTASVGWGLKQRGVLGKLLLIPVWDAFATLIWLVSFARKTIRWRGQDYLIRNGELVPVTPNESVPKAKAQLVP